MPRRQHAPAAERNAQPIIQVLKQQLPQTGRALEIASGTGQHAVAFARAFPRIEWVPSDPDRFARESIAAWSQEAQLPNLLPPLDIDVSRPGWHEGLGMPFQAILAINLVHISPWTATLGLLEGAGGLLESGGVLYLYGAYRRGGEHTAQSNVRFEEWLEAQSPEYGVRDMADVEREANAQGLALAEAIEMPANNFSLIFRKG